jgi:hypothetical protein
MLPRVKFVYKSVNVAVFFVFFLNTCVDYLSVLVMFLSSLVCCAVNELREKIREEPSNSAFSVEYGIKNSPCGVWSPLELAGTLHKVVMLLQWLYNILENTLILKAET